MPLDLRSREANLLRVLWMMCSCSLGKLKNERVLQRITQM